MLTFKLALILISSLALAGPLTDGAQKDRTLILNGQDVCKDSAVAAGTTIQSLRDELRP